MNTNGRDTRDVILLLFPWGTLGSRIARHFISSGYKVIALLFDSKRGGGSVSPTFATEGVLRVDVAAPAPVFWRSLDPSVKSSLLKARLFVHFVGNDFFTLKVGGQNEEWSLDANAPAQTRFSLIEILLASLEAAGDAVWVNIGVGTHKMSETGDVFCTTRYGLTGFTKILELTPRLARFQVLNLCLTYFSTKSAGREDPKHCTHCVTEDLRASNQAPIDESDIPEFLERKVRELEKKRC